MKSLMIIIDHKNQNYRMKNIIVFGIFDDIRSKDVRFLHEASELGRLRVLLWTDEVITAQTVTAPKFSEAERIYFLNALRYVDEVVLADEVEPDKLPGEHAEWSDIWVVSEAADNPQKKAF